MKNLLPFLLVGVLLGGCVVANPNKRNMKAHPHVVYFPEAVRNLYFGMGEAEFAALNTGATLQETPMRFRKVWLWEHPSPEITGVGMYFGVNGNAPLYELILNYTNVSARDIDAYNLLGPTNADDGEWRFATEEGFDVRAWKFDPEDGPAKLIITGLLEGTEWYEEEQ